jgi:hypothetical protein
LQNLLHASDAFKLSTFFQFCMTHGLTLKVAWEEVTETLHGNLTFQPYNCTVYINSFSTTVMVGWGRSSLDWLAHKISGIVTQLLFQQNALVFIKSTRYYNLYFLSLYS